MSPHQRVITAYRPTSQQSTHYWAISHWPLALWAVWASDGLDESSEVQSGETAQWELCVMKQKPHPIKNQLSLSCSPPQEARKMCQITAKEPACFTPRVLCSSLVWAARFTRCLQQLRLFIPTHSHSQLVTYGSLVRTLLTFLFKELGIS